MSDRDMSADRPRGHRPDSSPAGCTSYPGRAHATAFHPVLSVRRDYTDTFWIVDTGGLHGEAVEKAFDTLEVPHPGDEWIRRWEIHVAWYAAPDFQIQRRKLEPTIVTELAVNPFMALRMVRQKLSAMHDGLRPIVSMRLPLEPLSEDYPVQRAEYTGWSDGRTWRVFIRGAELSCVPSQKVRNWSLAGFRWGGPGPGAKQLALGLLLDAVGEIPSIRLLAPVLARDVIERLGAEWGLSRRSLLNWVAGQPAPNEDSEPPSSSLIV